MRKKLKLGHTGIELSALCLGTMYFGSRIDAVQSFKLLDQYVDAGGDFIDTANNYAFWVDGFAGGESETVIGQWMQQRKNRDAVFLATKIGYNQPPERPPSLSMGAIRAEVEGSLRRLQTDTIDLLYAHIDDRNTPLEETLETFADLVAQGKVRYIGCSNTLTWRIQQARILSQANGWPNYCVVQQRHSYLRPKATVKAFGGLQVPVTAELIDYLAAHSGIFAGVAYSTLLGGTYASDGGEIPEDYQPDDYDLTDIDAQFAVLRHVAAEHDATLGQVVLAWIVQNTPPMFALISSSSTTRLEENLNADKIELTVDQIKRLNRPELRQKA